jgi:hypothetical protein
VQPTNHHPSGEADEPAEKDALEGAFEPGDSFANDSSDEGGSGELPAWLQNFADVASEQVGGTATPGTPVMEPAPASPEPGHEMNAAPASFGEQPSADAGFFSDDDLPEWLRALSTDGDPAAGIEQRVAAPVASATPNGALQVPPISRAWVTANDQPEVSPGANLLSSLVHVIDSRPDAVAVPAAASAGAGVPSPSQPVATQPKPKSVAAPKPEASVATPGWGRLRIVAIAAIVLIVLLVIVMVLGN